MKGKYIALAGLLLASCAQTQDKEFYLDRINRASSIEVMLNTVTKVANEEPTTYEKTGNGFVVGEYIFSRDHVTSRYSVPKYRLTPYGNERKDFPLDREAVLNEETFLDDLVLHSVYENDDDDVAIFDLSKQPELCEKYCNDLTLDDLMTEDELYQGMRVYFSASPGVNRNGYYKESHIVKLRDEEDKGGPGEDSFMIQEIIIPGTSGKPLWHENKIIGVAHYFWRQMSGWGFTDLYIKQIKKYELENGIQKRS